MTAGQTDDLGEMEDEARELASSSGEQLHLQSRRAFVKASRTQFLYTSHHP